MHEVIAIHLFLRFNPYSFMVDIPAFFDRFPTEISSRRISAKGGGFGTTQWLKVSRADGSSMTEQDQTEMLLWLNDQSEMRVVRYVLDDIKSDPYISSL